MHRHASLHVGKLTFMLPSALHIVPRALKIPFPFSSLLLNASRTALYSLAAAYSLTMLPTP